MLTGGVSIMTEILRNLWTTPFIIQPTPKQHRSTQTNSDCVILWEITRGLQSYFKTDWPILTLWTLAIWSLIYYIPGFVSTTKYINLAISHFHLVDNWSQRYYLQHMVLYTDISVLRDQRFKMGRPFKNGPARLRIYFKMGQDFQMGQNNYTV